ncbi:MAG: helix-turn-helix transcriptional regulator [Bacillales bacterium]|nr:helix-turn-helix transcriptional regulator [Bacillales bacterium]MDD7316526.1 helix-turn-helix transcriptional regulator [Bacillales bacterium]
MRASYQLGMRIVYLRKQRGWTQEELSFQSGINKNYICDMENGRRNPSLEIIERLAIAFGISISDLFLGVVVSK